MDVFYAGDAKPFFSQNVSDGFGVNFGATANRPFFVRVYAYPCAYNGYTPRTDQTVAFTFVDPKKQGIISVYAYRDYLAPICNNNLKK